MRFYITAAVLIMMALIGITQTAFVVDQTQQAIITQFGVYQRTITSPGLHAKIPFTQTVHYLDKRLLRFDASPSEYLTGDKKTLVVDAYARWRIADPLLFYQRVGTEDSAQVRLQGVIASQLREEVASHNQIEIVRNSREALMRDVTQRSAAKAKDFGIEITDVRIGRADFPPGVATQVYNRMKSERLRIANQYRAEGTEQATAIRAEADKKRTVLLANAEQQAAETRGEGEAEAIRIYGAAINLDQEFFAFLRTLQVYTHSIGDNTTVVLPADSDLLKYFTSPAPPGARK